MIPTFETTRLILRPFTPLDGPEVERLAGVRAVADTTLQIPHPYPEGGGAAWIETHQAAWEAGTDLALAITLREPPRELLGAISLAITRDHARGEIGYWVAAHAWGKGYATEAARAMISYAFGGLGLFRVEARHFIRNPASGRVMQKLGMALEGVHRSAFLRWGRFEDVAVYSILLPEWRSVPVEGAAR